MKVYTLRLALLLAILAILAPLTASSQTVTTGPMPSWVNPMGFDPDRTVANGDAGSTIYLLCDFQVNREQEQTYRHFAIKVLNSAGVQEASDVVTDFDPTYQNQELHYVRIHRQGQVLEKLSADLIKTYQREESMERNLYDGSLTAVVHLTDVRRGDIIEYAYTTSGFNPIHDGRFATQYYLQYAVAVGEFFVRILTPEDDPLQHRTFYGAPEPERLSGAHGDEYVWHLQDMAAYPMNSTEPAWYDPHPRIALSTFESWNDVVQWALPLYQISDTDLRQLSQQANELMTGDTDAQRIMQAVHFVQDEVRYLGFMGGLGGYKPNSPTTVLERRYGDCKDKSLLLVGLLRAAGFEAHPVLVNSVGGEPVRRAMPTPFSFDHCITAFRLDGELQFVDATLGFEGGDLEHVEPLPYGRGLVLAPGIATTDSLPPPVPTPIKVDVRLDVSDTSGVMTMSIETSYTGARANSVRSFLASNSLDVQYLSYGEYYRTAYPSIQEPDTMNIVQDDRDGENRLVVNEVYTVLDFWAPAASDTTVMRGEYHPYEIREYLDHTAPRDNTSPFGEVVPIDFTQTVSIIADKEWPWTVEDVVIEGEGYIYSSKFRVKNGVSQVDYHYRCELNHVPGDQVATFIADHSRMVDDLGIVLTDGDELEASGPLSWFAIMLALIIIVVATVFAGQIYRNYDPPAAPFKGPILRLDGWLVLVGFGVVLRPLVEFFTTIFAGDSFNAEVWITLMTGGAEGNSSLLLALITMEIVAGCTSLVLGILVAVLYFKRRTSLPRLYSIHLVGIALWSILDVVIYAVATNGAGGFDEYASDIGTIIGGLIGAAIWIPYMFVSQRVKATFVVRRQAGETPGDGPGPMPDSGSTTDIGTEPVTGSSMTAAVEPDSSVDESGEVAVEPEPIVQCPRPDIDYSTDPFLRQLQAGLPDLTASLQVSPDQVAIHFAAQDTLSRDVTITSDGAGLIRLTIDGIAVSWPAGDECRVVILGLLGGHYRLVEEVRDNRVVKAQIQRPNGQQWRTVENWQGHGQGMPWQRKTLVVSLRRSL